MAELNLTQAEADALISMEKSRVDEQEYEFLGLGGAVTIPLVSKDKRENFMLDISRGRIDLAKVKYQNRARQVVILVRLDLSGQIHRNPDEEEIPCPHIHIYREGYGDKWAMHIPEDRFPKITDHWQTLEDFMRFCDIIEPPKIKKGLFT